MCFKIKSFWEIEECKANKKTKNISRTWTLQKGAIFGSGNFQTAWEILYRCLEVVNKFIVVGGGCVNLFSVQLWLWSSWTKIPGETYCFNMIAQINIAILPLFLYVFFVMFKLCNATITQHLYCFLLQLENIRSFLIICSKCCLQLCVFKQNVHRK